MKSLLVLIVFLLGSVNGEGKIGAHQLRSNEAAKLQSCTTEQLKDSCTCNSQGKRIGNRKGCTDNRKKAGVELICEFVALETTETGNFGGHLCKKKITCNCPTQTMYAEAVRSDQNCKDKFVGLSPQCESECKTKTAWRDAGCKEASEETTDSTEENPAQETEGQPSCTFTEFWKKIQLECASGQTSDAALCAFANKCRGTSDVTEAAPEPQGCDPVKLASASKPTEMGDDEGAYFCACSASDATAAEANPEECASKNAFCIFDEALKECRVKVKADDPNDCPQQLVDAATDCSNPEKDKEWREKSPICVEWREKCLEDDAPQVPEDIPEQPEPEPEPETETEPTTPTKFFELDKVTHW